MIELHLLGLTKLRRVVNSMHASRFVPYVLLINADKTASKRVAFMPAYAWA